ncbi:MAG TPA: sulfur globule protein precursor [Xanthobacteraceae bacterium]|jgi:hypothetical protein
MLHKIIPALTAGATLGLAALAPNAASAHPGWWWHQHGYFPFHRVYGAGYGGCMVQRWVYSPYGPVLHWVDRCY